MQHEELVPGIEIHGLTLFLREENTVIFADLHLGYEEELNAHGFLVPRFQYGMIVEYLREILSSIRVNRVIINGDLKHEFGRISDQEWNEVLNFLDFLSDYSREIVLIKGNHDTIIGPIAGKKGVKVLPYYFFKKRKIYITHGHKIPSDKDFKSSEILVIAHDHPALALREEIRSEKIKCFLKGNWNGKILIQIPSLNFITEGTDITQGVMLSPFMSRNLDEFEVYGVEDDRIFYFGRLGDME